MESKSDTPAALSEIPEGAVCARRMGLLIPEFPTQTHIAMWRLGQAIAERGVDVQMLSTRRPANARAKHPELIAAAGSTFYAWPASIIGVAIEAVRSIVRLPAAAWYAFSLAESSIAERIKALMLVLPSLSLKRHARLENLDYIFVHSCAGAAHLLAMCRVLGGPPYSLRLGGEPSVYGKDHRSKMSLADYVVAAARVNKQEAHNITALPDDRIVWSWLGMNTSRFKLPSRRGGALTDPKLVTVARLNHAKGHRYVIDSIARLVERGLKPEYVLVGDGPARAELEARVSAAGLEQYVVFAGECDQEGILKRLREADLFLLPTSGPGEGSPMAVVEAMSAGLPVIASDVGGLRDMVEVGTHGVLVPPADAEAIESVVADLSADGELRVAMGIASASRAAAEFDVSAVAQRLDHLFFGVARDRVGR